MIGLDENLRYTLQEEAAIEDFEDGSLLLLCKQLRLIQLSKTARRILALMDGQHNLRQITNKIAHEYEKREKDIRADILKLTTELGYQGVIKPLVKISIKREKKMSNTSKFMVNPDISLREENGDGAILFNPDSNSLQVINPVGLIIWQFLVAHPRTKSDIVNHLKEICEDIHQEQVMADVSEFITDLHSRGFIGEVLDDDSV